MAIRPNTAAHWLMLPRLLILITLSATAMVARANEATLLVVSGAVAAARAGGSDRVLAAGEIVRSGDTIVTAADGRAQLRFSDGAIVSLQPATRFRIDEYAYASQTQRGFFTLLRGALRTSSGAVGKRNPNDYQMRTPTATIGIRGTDYVAEVTACDPICSPGPREGLRVAVTEGRVVVANPAGQVEVAQGQAAAAASLTSAPTLTDERPVLPPRAMRPVQSPTLVNASGRSASDRSVSDQIAADQNGAGQIAPSANSSTIAQNAVRSTTAPSPTSERADSPDESKLEPLTAGTSAIDSPAGEVDSASGTTTGNNAARSSGSPSNRVAEPSIASAGAPIAPITPITPITPIGNSASYDVGQTLPSSNNSSGIGNKVGVDASTGATVKAANNASTTSSSATLPTLWTLLPSDGNTGLPGIGSAIVAPNMARTEAGVLSTLATAALCATDCAAQAKTGGSPTDVPLATAGATSAGGTSSGANSSATTGSGTSGSGTSGSGTVGSGSTGSTGSGGVGGTGGTGGTIQSGSTSSTLFSVSLRGVPVLNSLTFASANSLVTLDSEKRLQSIGLCPNTLCLSRDEAYVGEAGHDAYVSWGRWKAGEVKLRTLGRETEINLNGNQGLHYLVGVPTAVMPTSGSFSYSLTGSTLATTSDGSVAPGKLSASALVQFATGSATKVGLQGSVNFSNASFTFASTGGLNNPSASNVTMSSPNTFSGSLLTERSGTNLLNCSSAGCTTQLRGGFYGPDAARMGIDYTITGGTPSGRTINGVGVLTKQ